jgi:hypothetical protein
MKEQMQTPKAPSDQPRSPMGRLDDKEVGQVAGGPMGAPTLTPKKP